MRSSTAPCLQNDSGPRAAPHSSGTLHEHSCDDGSDPKCSAAMASPCIVDGGRSNHGCAHGESVMDNRMARPAADVTAETVSFAGLVWASRGSLPRNAHLMLHHTVLRFSASVSRSRVACWPAETVTGMIH